MAALSFGTKILAELILARRTRRQRAYEQAKHGIACVREATRIVLSSASQPFFFPAFRRSKSTHRSRSGASSHSNESRFPVVGCTKDSACACSA